MPTLTPDEAAETIVAAIEKKQPLAVRPWAFRALLVLNALMPRLVASQLRRASKSAQ